MVGIEFGLNRQFGYIVYTAILDIELDLDRWSRYRIIYGQIVYVKNSIQIGSLNIELDLNG